MWPLDGNDLQRSLADFLVRKLKFTPGDVANLGEIRHKKGHSRPSARIKNEYIVTFESTDARDSVRAAADNLAGDTKSGMRLHIPGHLEPNFKILEHISYLLKQKYATLRRNIKFDEPNMDLVLDFQSEEGEPWRSIRPAQAKKYASAPRNDASQQGSSRNKSLDDISDILGDPPEADDS